MYGRNNVSSLIVLRNSLSGVALVFVPTVFIGSDRKSGGCCFPPPHPHTSWRKEKKTAVLTRLSSLNTSVMYVSSTGVYVATMEPPYHLHNFVY